MAPRQPADAAQSVRQPDLRRYIRYGVRATDRRRQKPGRPGTGRRPPRAGEADVFLPDRVAKRTDATQSGQPARVPAYITREQFDRNQAQLRANRADHLGPVRSGTALLSGLVVCGRCGLRMTAAYNNAGHAARYICGGENSSYGAPFCQSLKSAPVDEQVTSIVLQALEPAALEASLAVAADLQAERAALEQQWRQRLERAQYKVDQARRRYASTEPENRLVARTLERDWEEALAEQVRLTADHERFRREPLVWLFQRLRRRNLGQPRPPARGTAGNRRSRRQSL